MRAAHPNALATLAAASAAAALATAAASAAPAETIDVGQFPAAVYEDVIIPVPSEIFAVLDKLGSPDWDSMLPAEFPGVGQQRERIALRLGNVIADGFIAVQAGSPEVVKDIGREVLKLAGAIGVRDAVIARSRRITDAADEQNWTKVRRELDGAMQDVKQAMVELHDEELAQLVSLGGWLRGTQALTAAVDADYRAETAELLHQPALLEYFARRIGGMPAAIRDHELVAEIRAQLERIRPLIDVGDGRGIQPDSVREIHAMTSGLVTAIAAPPEA